MKAFIFSALVALSGWTMAQENPAPTTETSTTETKKAKKSKAEKTSIYLQNTLVIGQMDTPEDRYSMEITLTEMLAQQGVKAMPSLNVLKLGSDARILATDSIQKLVAAKGVDTYCIVSIRGFDRNYTISNRADDFETALDQASFFKLYRDDAVSVTFQFKFFRNNECIHAEIVKCGNIGSRESVLKRFRKKVGKRIKKSWTKA